MAGKDRGAHAPEPSAGPEARRGPTVWLVLSLLALLVAFLLVRRHLAAVVLALTAGYLLHRPYAWLAQRIPKRWPAATIMLVMVAVILLAPIAILVLLFLEDAKRIAASIDSRADVQEGLEEFLLELGVPPAQVEASVARLIQEASTYLQSAAVPLVSLAADVVIGLFVFFILLFYLFVDGAGLAAFVTRSLPAPRAQVQGVLLAIGERVQAIVYGTVGVAFLQAALATIGWWVLDLPAPFFWGFVMLVLEVVPLVGSFVVLLPAAVWAFMTGDIKAGIGLLVLNFLMVGVIDDIVRPYMIGRRSGVHPALVLLGIIGGIPLFGLAGIILGPLLMGVLVPLWEAWLRPGAHVAPGDA